MTPFTSTNHPLPSFADFIFQKKSKTVAWILLAVIMGLYVANLFKVANKHYAGNPSGFACIGILGKCPELYHPSMLIRDDMGYDSQYFYYIALNPFAARVYSYENNDIVDAYRYQRYLYGFLAGLISFESPRVIPYALLGINILSIAIGTFILMLLCDHFKVSRLISLFFACSIASYLCLLRTTAEPLYLCLILAGIYCHVGLSDFKKSAFFFCLAVLTKEIALVTVAGLFVYEIFIEKKYQRTAWMILPLLTYALMQIFIFLHFETPSFALGVPAVLETVKMYPLQGFVNEIASLWGDSAGRVGGNLFLTVILLNILFSALVVLVNLANIRKLKNPFLILGPLYIGLAHLASSAPPSMIDLWGYGRHTAEIFVCLLLLYCYQRRTIFLLPVGINAACAGILLLNSFFQ